MAGNPGSESKTPLRQGAQPRAPHSQHFPGLLSKDLPLRFPFPSVSGHVVTSTFISADRSAVCKVARTAFQLSSHGGHRFMMVRGCDVETKKEFRGACRCEQRWAPKCRLGSNLVGWVLQRWCLGEIGGLGFSRGAGLEWFILWTAGCHRPSADV